MTAAGRTALKPTATFLQDVPRILLSRQALVVIAILGVLLRAALYVSDRSLTLDESFVALNLKRRSPGELLGQLDWNSAAPFGFLEFEKGVTAVFGSSEHVLRALPFVASFLALLLVIRLALRVAQLPTAVVGTFLFAGLATPISYAALTKPYSLDVACVTALCLATLVVLASPGRYRPLLVLAILGLTSPAFSYASVFALAGSASLLVTKALRQRNRGERLGLLAVPIAWSTAAAGWYLWHGDTLSHLRDSFGGGDEYISSLSSIRAALGAMRILLGVSPSGSHFGSIALAATVGAAIFFLAGVVELVRRGWEVPAILLLPGIFAAMASAAHLYPLTARTMLFLTPMLVICVSVGLVSVLRRARPAFLRGATLALVSLMMVSEASSTTRVLSPLRGDEGMRPVMKALSARQRPTDDVYLGPPAQYPFAYYLQCDCASASVKMAFRRRVWDVVPENGTVDQFSPALKSRSPRFIIGSFGDYGLQSYYRDFGRLRKRGRVWIIVSFLHAGERRALAARLDQLGTRLASFGGGTGVDAVTAYLYRF